MSDLIIREIVKNDIDNGFLETLSNLSITDIDPDYAKKLIQVRKQSNNITTIVAVNSTNQVFGTASLMVEQKISHNGGLVGHIEDVAVKSNYEGNGIGKKLVQKLIKLAQEKGCYKVVLTDSKGNKDFYEKTGMHVDGLSFRLNLQ